MAKLAAGVGVKQARFIAIYLAIELVPFIVIHLVYHKPAAVLVFPYLVFGMPALAMVPVYGLWLLDARGASARLLGVCWFWLMQIMFSVPMLGIIVGGWAVHVLSRDEAVWGFAVMQAIMAPVIFFAGYLKVRTLVAARRSEGAI